MTHEAFLRLVQAHHPELAKHLGTDIGLRAQFVDSQIAEAVMLDFLRDGIGILPVHDSFIVPAGHADALRERMRYHFRQITGSDAKVTEAEVKQNEHFGMDKEQLADLAKDPEQWAISGKDIPLNQLIDSSQYRGSVMGKYTRAWAEA